MIRVGVILFLLNIVYAQLPEYSIYQNGSIPENRQIILLNEKWVVDDKKSVKQLVDVPSFFDVDKITLKKELRIDKRSKNDQYFLHFRGVTGLKELYFNDERIPFDAFSLERYKFSIPENLIRSGQINFIKIILSNSKRIKEQQSLTANLLIAEKKIGLYKDIYLEILPSISITNVNLRSKLEENLSLGKILYNVEVTQSKFDSSITNLELRINVSNSLTGTNEATNVEVINLSEKSKNIVNGEIQIKNPALWSNSKPSYYEIELELLKGKQRIDRFFSQISFRDVRIDGSKFLLNGKQVQIQGVTYFESNGIKNSFFTLKEYSRDISLIKNLKANAILVKGSLPSEEFLQECEKNGVLVFVELDSRNYHPLVSKFIFNELNKKVSYLTNVLSHYNCIVGLGLNYDLFAADNKLLVDIANEIKKSEINYLLFSISDKVKIKSSNLLDFNSINLLQKPIDEIKESLFKLNKGEFFLVNSIGYNHDLFQEEGYSNKHSIQAQAKYLMDILKILKEHNLSFFIHTFSDYRVNYNSIFSGKYDSKLLKFGLVNEYRDIPKLSYSTVKSHLTEAEIPFIMKGDYSDSANIIFVFFGMFLLAFSILIINSTSRFKENVSRAVFKTYNFFSDIRDGWFISSIHSMLLGIMIVFAIALLYSSYIYYLKDFFWFEKFMSLFNCPLIFEFLSYISWRPLIAIFYLALLGIVFSLLISFVIKSFNLFMKHKVYMNQILLVVIWSGIPFLISIPLGMVAYKILSGDNFNVVMFLLFVLFHLWVITRLVNGISIIFDKRKTKVYLTSIIFVLLIIVILGFILQTNFGSIDYLVHGIV